MSMLSCRVLCLLAIVLCCVGVANANADPQAKSIAGTLKKAHDMAKESSNLKEECETATEAAEDAAAKAAGFAITIQSRLTNGAVNISDVDKKKEEGNQLIDRATKAAEKAKGLASKTSQVADDVFVTAASEIETAKQRDESFQKMVDAELHAMNETNMATIETITEAVSKNLTTASVKAYAAAQSVETAVKEVEEAIKKLVAAVAAAEQKKKEPTKAERENMDSQARPQTQDPTAAGQQGQTEGSKTQQTEEKRKDAQGQRSRRTITLNVRGENLDSLFNYAANKSGMALHDSSSIPALLRVPLLLLLLFSVLGCMTVC
ncbi:hypothetical protein LSM04_000873 [Trypanosoma melophagium]|uniref:uncharacterized protein n=1 Tax=Trypanosoma melophagium TaxID=715481 RepID=UPI00351A7033|nr:hypothetical protein LSM04_000873 [Trypanosoma melophagium]